MPGGLFFSYRCQDAGTPLAYDPIMASLNAAQCSLIIGTLLGDGAMRCKRNPLLEINHGHAQQGYVDWKYEILSEIVATGPKIRPSGGQGRLAYRFTTLSVPQLMPFYRLFYPAGTKIVPWLRLTPLALAVWFMDDGSKSYRAVYLNTQQFDIEGQQRLVAMLEMQFAVRATLNRDKQYHRLRISVSSVAKLKRLISPYLLSEMTYKLP